MKIRAYHLGEEHEIWQLFQHTVHHVNARDYTKKQLNAWAPAEFNTVLWTKKLAELGSFVCVDNKKIIGYGDLQQKGYIDHFFCHHQYQGQGVGSALMVHIHGLAAQQQIKQLSADVSITAKAFFEKNGFTVTRPQVVTIRGQALTNFKMEKQLV
ncbi:GNAT family N-acetyltransferase [uncultured Paraglaciecola sp.]|uniref:GNAT family N-acetyltransferase n=1 Tax=uncultured Paraglaciecola sp. TaxID=1765024 RepID=UPI0026090180|nr:GNAT family N-acetyltransferase [uncultured Paraglaciecola sp.]